MIQVFIGIVIGVFVMWLFSDTDTSTSNTVLARALVRESEERKKLETALEQAAERSHSYYLLAEKWEAMFRAEQESKAKLHREHKHA